MTSLSSLLLGNHERISITARAVAYFRTFSDIPYASETSWALEGKEAAIAQYSDDLEMMTKFAAPLLEARYKSFNRLIEMHRSVLELAMGTSISRGLLISQDPDCLYVGTDLPGVIRDSKDLLNSIPDASNRNNHRLHAANVLSSDDLSAAVSYFGPRRDLLVINEGLWFYLTLDEQRVVANNLRRILEQYGGKWVTPDIWDTESNERLLSYLPLEMRVIMRKSQERTERITGRDIEKNYLRSRSETTRFLEDAGFKIEQYPMVDDLGTLSSIKKVWGDQDYRLYEEALRQYKLSVISCSGRRCSSELTSCGW